MPEFSDFLGHILEEITRARAQADYAAITVAKMYSSDTDGLLKHFPVPRMRLPNIEITAPVIIVDVPDGHVDTTDPNVLKQSAAADIRKILTQQKINISTADITKIINADDSLSKGYINDSSANNLSQKIGDQINTKNTKSRITQDTHDQVVSLIREQLVKTFTALPRRPLGIQINATTSAVKEFSQSAGQSANVVYFKMTIAEDAMEIEMKDPAQPVVEGQTNIVRLTPE
jgi:hypothetical protein